MLKIFWWKVVAALTPPPKPISKRDLEIRQKKNVKDIITRVLFK